jgi:amino acid adenylation domain-containing protein
VGTPVANRNLPAIEDMVGVFINTLVIRTDVSGNPTFRELLARVRAEALGAFDHQDLPFERLMEEVRPERGTSQQGLFQVLFTYVGEFRKPATVEGLTWTVEPVVDNGTSKFDLTLFLENRPDRFLATVEYNTDLFEPATIERMVGHLQTLLEGIAADVEQRIGQLPFLTEAERHRLLVDWNRTEADYPRDRCLAQLIEEQAARMPERPAVIFEDQQLTFAELNRRANQLAHYLKTLGVGPDVLVGLCAERSTEMMVGLLGILKAGGAYVPLDPEFPRDRLAFYVQDSQMPVLVTQERLLERLSEHKAKVVRLDTDWPTIAQQPAHNPPAASKPDNLVYVIYTSGSTGKPKGVQVLQGALTNFLNSMRKQPGLSEQDVLLAVTTLSFDIHALEIWLPLLVGARVVIVSKEISTDGVRLLQRLNEIQATVMQATPATWRLLLASGWKESKQLKVLCGGEPMTIELANQLLPRVASLWNMYGPTETTVWSTIYEVKAVTGSISIGRPIDNTQIYIVDSQLQPVPVGGAGELLIGGDGLARGYLNRPELTAEKFIPDPFHPGPTNVLYKTGDLARYLPDGNIECLGRNDHQVKIRGFRIELGEIETVLGQHPAVRNAVVVARKEESGADYLVGYVIPQPSKDTAAEELRRFLNQSLPDYMVPAHFVTLASFPLTPNGKIDRKALPAPDRTTSTGQRVIVAPRSDAESDLAAIWEEVLKVKPVSVVDDFFELGGHSFLAAVLVAKIKLQLGHTIQLGTLFAAPTVEKLAGVLERSLETGTGSSIVPLREEGASPPLFMIAGVGGHVFTFHKFARLLGNEQPTYGVKAIGVEGNEEPPDRIEDIAARYLQEITALRPDGPYLLSGYSVGATVAFELALQLQARGKKVERLIVFDMVAPGYPKPLPVHKRLWIHTNNFFKLPFAGKKSYLSERFWNVKGRVFRALGLGIYNAPAIEGVDALPQTALKKVWAALNLAQSRYKPQGKYHGPIILMKAEVGLDYAATIFDDPLMGWGEWTTQPIEDHTIPGAHLELFHEGNIQRMAEKLKESLQRNS